MVSRVKVVREFDSGNPSDSACALMPPSRMNARLSPACRSRYRPIRSRNKLASAFRPRGLETVARTPQSARARFRETAFANRYRLERALPASPSARGVRKILFPRPLPRREFRASPPDRLPPRNATAANSRRSAPCRLRECSIRSLRAAHLDRKNHGSSGAVASLHKIPLRE